MSPLNSVRCKYFGTYIELQNKSFVVVSALCFYDFYMYLVHFPLLNIAGKDKERIKTIIKPGDHQKRKQERENGAM